MDSPTPTPAHDAAALDSLLDQVEQAAVTEPPASFLDRARQAWLAIPAGDDPRRARAGMLLTLAHHGVGELREAMDLGLSLLPLVRTHGAAKALVNLARVTASAALECGHFAVAMDCAREAHQAALAAAAPRLVGSCLGTLAYVHERLGDPAHAEHLTMEALAIAREDGDGPMELAMRVSVCAILIGAFHLQRDALPHEQAVEPLRRAEPMAREALRLATAHAGDPTWDVICRGNCGEVLLHLGQLDEAGEMIVAALVRAREHGLRAMAARVACTLGEWQLARGRAAVARATLMQALAEADGGGETMTRMRLHHALWRAARALGRSDDALAHLEAYLQTERSRTLTQQRAQAELFVSRAQAERAQHEAQRHRERAQTLEADAHHDPLTRLGNRRELARRWPTLLHEATLAGRPVSLAMLDLDHFKQINDEHGHAVGDAVLVAVAHLLGDQARASDLLVRLGGEEFAIVLPGTEASLALLACERLRETVAAHDWSALAPGLRLTMSIGVACSPPLDLTLLMERADSALYRAKREGRNAVCVG